ncbi:MAG: methyl-accepting chemotaxis protein [Pseudobdellovibrio sp.]
MLNSSNIKTETIKISVAILLSTVFLSAGLVYVANYSIKAVNTVYNLDAASLSANQLNAKISLAIADYSLLGTGNALEPNATLTSLKALEAEIADIIVEVEKINFESDEMKTALKTHLPEVKSKYAEVKSIGEKMVIDLLDDKSNEGKLKAKQLQTVAKEMFEHIQVISSVVPKITAAQNEQSINSLSTTRTIAIFGGLAATFILMGLVVYFYRFLSGTLRQIMTTLDNEVQTLHKNSNTIKESVYQMNAVCSSQTDSLSLTSSAMIEIDAMSNAIVDSTKRLSHLSKENNALAIDGQNDVKKMALTMGEIMKVSDDFLISVKTSTQSFSQITEIFEQIQDKTKVINDIVFQTKLLSFNASVEAARAGEFGKGFSVVAQEVGNLARVSAEAAGEINRLLSSSHQKVSTIVNGVTGEMDSMAKKSKESLNYGFAQAKECEKRLQSIVEKVSEVNKKTGEIDLANREQSVGVTQIGNAINNVKVSNDDVVQNLNVVFESVEYIKNQSKVLDSLVQEIKEKTVGVSAEHAVEAHHVESKVEENEQAA